MMGVAQVIGMKPTLRSFFSGAPLPWAKASRAVAERQDRGNGGHRRGRADRLQELAALGVDREDRAQDRCIDHPVPDAPPRPPAPLRRQAGMVGLGMVAAAAAAAAAEQGLGVERVLEHREPPPRLGAGRRVAGARLGTKGKALCQGLCRTLSKMGNVAGSAGELLKNRADQPDSSLRNFPDSRS